MVRGLPRSARLGAVVLVGFIAMYMLVPMVVVVGSSLNRSRFLSFPPDGLSLQWYADVLTSDVYLPALRTSLLIAVTVAVVSGVIGTMAAIALTRFRVPGRGLILNFIMSPLIVPSIILAIGMLAMLSAYGNGPSATALMAGHAALTIPYVTRTVTGVMQQADPHVDEAARVMGARPWQRYLYVVLPQARAGIAAGVFFAFNVSFDEAVVALFLRTPQLETLPIAIYSQLQFSTDPSVAAVSSIMVVLTIVIVIMLEWTLGLGKVFGDDG